MAITRQQKENHVAEIKDLLSKSNIVIVWDYLGLSAKEVSGIRTTIRNEQAVNKVYKNRIAKIAFKESGKEEILEHLEGPSAFLFIDDDESNALKELNKYIKQNENLSFKAGYIDGEFYDAEAVAEIAGLPSKEDLLSMLLSALQGTMRNLAYALSQIAEQAPAGEEAPAVEEAAPQEETATEEVNTEDAAPAEESVEEEKTEEEAPAEETPAEDAE